jgi:hypothetical protein
MRVSWGIIRPLHLRKIEVFRYQMRIRCLDAFSAHTQRPDDTASSAACIDCVWIENQSNIEQRRFNAKFEQSYVVSCKGDVTRSC